MGGINVTPLRMIENIKGNIYHVLKTSETDFDDFGEAYFSLVKKNTIKGWKKHLRMTLNLVVPFGEIQFVIYDESDNSFTTITLSPENYKRLTIKPNLWLAFRGVGDNNILLNIASIEHDPKESINVDLEAIKYAW